MLCHFATLWFICFLSTHFLSSLYNHLIMYHSSEPHKSKTNQNQWKNRHSTSNRVEQIDSYRPCPEHWINSDHPLNDSHYWHTWAVWIAQIKHQLALPWLARWDHLEHRDSIEGSKSNDYLWMSKASYYRYSLSLPWLKEKARFSISFCMCYLMTD